VEQVWWSGGMRLCECGSGSREKGAGAITSCRFCCCTST
jgi:hypothetical protein